MTSGKERERETEGQRRKKEADIKANYKWSGSCVVVSFLRNGNCWSSRRYVYDNTEKKVGVGETFARNDIVVSTASLLADFVEPNKVEKLNPLQTTAKVLTSAGRHGTARHARTSQPQTAAANRSRSAPNLSRTSEESREGGHVSNRVQKMDSPVVLDKASEFGEPIDLDRPFPGFSFDDEGFGRRSDIRAHLDQLAARHPEFADHLLGPAWGDIPFHGSLRTRNRRDSGNGLNNNYQGYSDEDARSQASGSSAASGASAVSSHGEPEGSHNHREKSRDRPDTEHQQFTGRTQIPQYGFRNTVDIGQHRHNMDNPDKGNRGQRSMSAPPENRQQPYQCHHNCQQQQQQPLQSQPQSQQQPQPGQRYVSRIDITPQHNQPQQQQPQPQPQPQPQHQPQPQPQPQSQPQPQPQPQQPQQPQQQKPASQQQGNVRHIPIFVEGRDEPVLPRNFDEQHFKREPSPTQFHTPPHFQRSSAFGQSPFERHRNWSPHFQDSFYPPETGYEQPSRRQQQTHGFQHPRQQQQQQQQQPQYEKQPQPQQYEKQAQPQQQRQRYAQHPQQQSQQQQPQQQRQQDASPPRPKQVVPKDALERVAMVQKEVDSLAEQVKAYTGNSRKDKQYMYLDEMLTRELIKLDDIETEGRENVRQARRNAIKTIQETIGLLESMAPLASQPATPQQIEKPIIPTVVDQPESMDVDRKQEEQTNEPIPLPPGPSSPQNKKPEETVESCEEEEKNKKSTIDAEQPSNPPIDSASVEPMDTAASVVEKPEEKPTEPTPMDVQEGSEGSNLEEKKPNEGTVAMNVPEQNASDQKKVENDSSSATSDVVPEKLSGESTTTVQPDVTAPEQKIEQQELASDKMEVDGTVKQSPKIPKKGKKTKKQTTVSASPVCDTPIPLPPPESTETKAK